MTVPGNDYEASCELCQAHRISPWFYEDTECWIAECESCSTPMIVWRRHGLPDPETEERLIGRLRATADAHFGEGEWWLDGRRRNIPDHWHCHARPAGGFFGRGWR